MHIQTHSQLPSINSIEFQRCQKFFCLGVLMDKMRKAETELPETVERSLMQVDFTQYSKSIAP